MIDEINRETLGKISGNEDYLLTFRKIRHPCLFAKGVFHILGKVNNSNPMFRQRHMRINEETFHMFYNQGE